MAGRLARKRLELVATFEPGHGRPDLEMLYRTVRLIDLGRDSFDVRDSIVNYLNTRPEEVRLP